MSTPGAGFDEDPISFGEAFGINPDGSAYEAPPAPDPTPEPAPEPEPSSDGSGDPGAEPADPSAEPEPTEWEKRGLKTTEDVWKSYRELETRFSQRDSQAPAPAQETPPPAPAPSVPLFKGEVSDIKTEADLYNWAAADPASAALFAMENHERLNAEQLNNVMDNWLAREPWKAISHISSWNLQMARDEFAERQAVQDAHYLDTMRDSGIKAAIAEQPMLKEYQHQLGEFIEQNPKLQQMVDAARTADELKQALHGIFYMMSGPKIATQLLEAQVTQQLADKAAADAAAAAEATTQRATSMNRNTAAPPGENDTLDDAIRAKILASKR